MHGIIQLYRGVVIKINGEGEKKRFTVRKMSGTIGVERIFPMESPNIEYIEVNKHGKVRRAKLYYLRNLTGKPIEFLRELFDLTDEPVKPLRKLRNLTNKLEKLSYDLRRVKDELKKLSDNLEDLSGEQKEPRNERDWVLEEFHALNEALAIEEELPWKD